MQFSPYKGFHWQLHKQRKRERGGKTNIKQTLIEDVRKALHYSGKVYEGHLPSVILSELIHYNLTHKVVYVPKAFAEKLTKANLKFHFEVLRIPQCIFEICFENDYLPSALVVVKPDQAFCSAVDKFIAMATSKKINSDALKDDIISIVHGDGRTNKEILGFTSTLNKFEGKTVEQAIEDSDLKNIYEKEKQTKLMKVIVGILAYWNSKNPDVKIWESKNRGKLGYIKPTGFIIGKEICQTQWFIRSGGPVVLAHPRYKRDEEGNIRIIWRKAAEHNKWADPRPIKPRLEEIK